MSTPLNAVFKKDKETKGTVRFEETPPEGSAPIVGSLYVKKHALQQMGNPDELIVTINPAKAA